MLRNFVVDADLKKYHPKLASFLWSTQTDYTVQIAEAFNLILDDIRAREIEARTLMIPLDLGLLPTNTDPQNGLTSITETLTTTHKHVVGRDGFNRFSLNVSAITLGGGTFSIALQGSNDANINDSVEPANWVTVATITPTTAVETSTVFQTEYKYYRIVNTVTGTSITYTASLYETYIDRWVMYRSLAMIFRDFAKDEHDIWSKRSALYDNLYANAFQNYKFTVDVDDNNRVNGVDIDESAQTTLCR